MAMPQLRADGADMAMPQLALFSLRARVRILRTGRRRAAGRTRLTWRWLSASSRMSSQRVTAFRMQIPQSASALERTLPKATPPSPASSSDRAVRHIPRLTGKLRSLLLAAWGAKRSQVRATADCSSTARRGGGAQFKLPASRRVASGRLEGVEGRRGGVEVGAERVVSGEGGEWRWGGDAALSRLPASHGGRPGARTAVRPMQLGAGVATRP